MKVLVSGFTTFDSHLVNSSRVIAELLGKTEIEGLKIQSVILPVAFRNAFDVLKLEIDRFQPDFVICLGLAAKRETICVEKIAVNLIHCDIPDNEGVLQTDTAILSDGPNAYYSTLPLESMLGTATEFPTNLSLSAGTYVCNYVMYRLLDYIEGTGMRGGFIHLPDLKGNQDQILSTVVKMLQQLKS